MRNHRAGAGLLVLCCLLSFASVPAASAQNEGGASIRLLRQTPWNGPEDPLLDVAVTARNDGTTAMSDLSLVLTIGSAIVARLDYEAALTGGPTTPIKLAATKLEGTLEPAQERTFGATIDLSTVALLAKTDSFVYPLRVELRSAATTMAELHSAVIYLWQKPEVPIEFQWTVELSAPITVDPSGRFVNDSLERALAPEGRISNQLAALEALATAAPPVPMTLVIAPLLVDQLLQMRDGYEVGSRRVESGQGGAANAATALESLRRIASSDAVELTVEPLASPSYPAMLASGLERDLAEQEAQGRTLVADALGVAPSTTIARPPGGALDDAVVDRFWASGVLVVLGDAETVDRPQQGLLGFAPLPTGGLTVAGETPLAVILPDPGTQALLTGTDSTADPVLTAQQVLGELATIWKESPVPAPGITRGVSVFLPASMPAGFWLPFARRIEGAAFLRPVGAARMATDIPPTGASRLRSPATAGFTRGYVDAIKRERRDIDAYRSMLVDLSDVPARLDRNLLYAEAGVFVGNEDAGRAFVDAAHDVTGSAFARVTPDTSQVFTTTSHSGRIPLRLGDPGDTPLSVVIRLQSVGLRFPEGDSQKVTLERAGQIVFFPVDITSSGSITVQILVESPSGRIVSESTLVVRSTAFNRIALALTFVAGLVLVTLWSRGFWRRRTR